MDFQAYLSEIRDLHASGRSTEHSFRPALARLFASIDPDIAVINEPKRLVDVGAPDFVFSRNDISIGWCEAKDIGKDVRKFAVNDYSKDQKARYVKGLSNLIYTNGLDFEFIRDGVSVDFVTIADLMPTMPARPDNFPVLARLLKDFVTQTPVSITSAKRLAEMMAGKAAIIKDIMGKALLSDSKEGVSTELTDQYDGLKASLIHDISMEDFADIYAETIAYGLFAARLHDPTEDTFSRTEALELLPKSNPFLRNLFVYIAGPNFDDRLIRMIDDLCDIFKATSLSDLLKDFGKFTARNDPFLHFYETFLAEYNPKKRTERGVWYTPEPVVNFIVRAVDDVLKSEFGLADGLADTSKVTIKKWDTGQTKNGKPVTIEKEVHRVQVLDPATGTGTFLAEVIKLVAGRIKGIAPGQWSQYVEQELIPRLHGFELLMASYAMCHMKLDMMLTEMGYKPSGTSPRLGVYLTNSLEEGERVEQSLPFARWVSEEAKGANTIKRDQPIMCVIGNPPYAGVSQNKGSWITGLIEDYKYVDGVHFGERKHWLQDDYVKFMRLAENMIAKNGEGILGFITNHGYLDNPTFRGMRWHLLKTFDRISVVNLHGNSNRQEVCPDGSSDEPVFNIKQGVAIIIARKFNDDRATKGLATVYHSEVWGTRKIKNRALSNICIDDTNWTKLEVIAPYHFLVPFDASSIEIYDEGFSLDDLFEAGSKGIITARDGVAVAFNDEELRDRIKRFIASDKTDDDIRREFFGSKKSGKYPAGDTRGWCLSEARISLSNMEFEKLFSSIDYRPFDTRTAYYGEELTDWPRKDIMDHVVARNNIALSFNRRIEADRPYSDALVFERLIQHHSLSIKEANDFRPLYLYPDEQDLDQSIRVNFDPKLYAKIRKVAGLSGPMVAPDGTDAFRKVTGEARPDEVKVFDYIYGTLHSPEYRETFAEFLKIDFPRVPFPQSPESFRDISEKGEALRRIHLMEDAAIGDAPFVFEGDGTSEVEKLSFDGNKVWINKTQGFAGVPLVAWEFHIGSYQPAQKWLKDRKGRPLSFDDIRHYQKIIKILIETDRIMAEIKLPLD